MILIRQFVSLALIIFGLSTFGAVAQNTATDNFSAEQAANTLYLDSVLLYQASRNLGDDEKVAPFNQIMSNIDKILLNYPGTALATRIQSGTPLSALNLNEVNSVLSRVSPQTGASKFSPELIAKRQQVDTLLADATKARSILEVVKDARLWLSVYELMKLGDQLGTVSESIEFLRGSQNIRLLLKAKHLTEIQQDLKLGLVAKSVGILGHAYIDMLYDTQSSRGASYKVARPVAHSLLDTAVNLATGNLVGQILDQSILILEEYLNLTITNRRLVSTVLDGSQAVLFLLSGASNDSRNIATARQFIANTETMSRSFADGWTLQMNVNAAARVDLIVHLLKIRAAQISGEDFMMDIATVKIIAEIYDKEPKTMLGKGLNALSQDKLSSLLAFAGLESTKFRDFADQTATDLGITGWNTPNAIIGNTNNPTNPLSTFDPREIDVFIRFGDLARLAYGTGDLSAPAQLATLGFQPFFGKNSSYFHDGGNSSEYLLARDARALNRVIIAIEGTDAANLDTNDLKSDMRFDLIEVPGLGQVHRGFYAHALRIFRDLVRQQALNAITAANPEFVISGHSLGGAASILLAAMIENHAASLGVSLSGRITVYTFGAPETGSLGAKPIAQNLNIQNIQGQYDPVVDIVRQVYEALPSIKSGLLPLGTLLTPEDESRLINISVVRFLDAAYLANQSQTSSAIIRQKVVNISIPLDAGKVLTLDTGRGVSAHSIDSYLNALKQAAPVKVVAPPAPTNGIWGPGIVGQPNRQLNYDECRAQDLRTCLIAMGLSDEAVRFSLAVTSPDQIGVSLGSEFLELGRVDLARAGFDVAPYEGSYFLNGQPALHDAGQYIDDLRRAFPDKPSRAVLASYPGATGWISSVASHRALPGGGQRFVTSLQITENCRACATIGFGITHLDFDTQGRLVTKTNVGIEDWRGKDFSHKTTIQELVSSPKMLQSRLNLLGYTPGINDGISGPQTRQALMEYQVEHCLKITGQLSAETVQSLTKGNQFTQPCAGKLLPSGLSANAPLLDGRYVRNPLYCDPKKVPYEIAHNEEISIGGSAITWGWEDGCAINRTDMKTGFTSFRGDCNLGNQRLTHKWNWDILSSASFRQISGFFEGAPQAVFNICPAGQATGPTEVPTPTDAYLEPAKGSALRKTILDSVRPLAVAVYGAPVEFVVDEIRVFNDISFAALNAQRTGGVPISIKQTPGYRRGNIDLHSGDPTRFEALLRHVDNRWQVARTIVGPTEAWWMDDCASWGRMFPHTCGDIGQILLVSPTAPVTAASPPNDHSLITNVADFFENNELTAISEFQKGRNILFEIRAPSYSGNSISVTNVYVPSSAKQAEQDLQNNFSWDKWFNVTQGNNSFSKQLQVICYFDASKVSNLTTGKKITVAAKLRQYGGSRLLLDCSAN